jgi:hypothetical protein
MQRIAVADVHADSYPNRNHLQVLRGSRKQPEAVWAVPEEVEVHPEEEAPPEVLREEEEVLVIVEVEEADFEVAVAVAASQEEEVLQEAAAEVSIRGVVGDTSWMVVRRYSICMASRNTQREALRRPGVKGRTLAMGISVVDLKKTQIGKKPVKIISCIPSC